MTPAIFSHLQNTHPVTLNDLKASIHNHFPHILTAINGDRLILSHADGETMKLLLRDLDGYTQLTYAMKAPDGVPYAGGSLPFHKHLTELQNEVTEWAEGGVQ